MSHKPLYIFATSERPDQYLNPILHCIDNENITKVVLVNIVGKTPDGTASDKGISDTVLRNVQVLWEGLARLGKYRFFVGKRKDEQVDLALHTDNVDTIKNFYSRMLEKKIKWEHTDIEYLRLKDELERIIAEHPRALFDVTAFDKSMIGDMVSIGIVSKIQSINTFDLTVRPDFDEPWNTLYHNLRSIGELSKAGYKYVNIIKTPIFNECEKGILLNTIPFKISAILAPLLVLIFVGINILKGSQSNWIVGLGIVASFVTIWSALVPFLTKKR